MQLRSRLLIGVIPLVVAACGGAPDTTTTTTTTVSQSRAQAGSLASSDLLVPGAYHDVIQRFYVAYFGRPADVSGLDFWSSQYLQNGMPLQVAGFTNAYGNDATVRQFVDAFGTSQESRDLYGGDNVAFITAVYRNLFNRDPDPVGLAYWLDKLERAVLTRPVAAFEIMRGAQGSDITIIDRKVAVATAFTVALDTDMEREAYGTGGATATVRAMLATVDAATDPASFPGIATTIAQLVGKLGPAQQYLSFFYGAGQVDRIGMVAPTGSTGLEVAPPGPKQSVSGLFFDPVPGPQGVTQDSETFWMNNRLYRQPLTSYGGVPTAIAVSTQARDKTCFTQTFTDYAAANKSVLVFQQPGADGVCSNGDDTYAAARMDMSNVSAPLAVQQTVFAIRSSAGALAGFLVRDGQQVKRVDPSFGSPVTMFTVPPEEPSQPLAPLYGMRDLGNLFLFNSGNTVFVWNGNRTSIAAPKALAYAFSYTFTFGDALAVDADTMYFTTREVGKISLNRYSAASDTVSTVAEIPAQSGDLASERSSLNMTANYFVVGNPVDNSVWVVPRAGGPARLLYSLGTKLEPAVQVAGERVWFATATSAGFAYATILTDGSGLQVIPNARSAGCVYRAGARVEVRNDVCASMLLYANDSLRGFDAVTASLAVNYGAVAPFLSTSFTTSIVSANRSRGVSGDAMLFTRQSIYASNFLTANVSTWRFVAGQPGLVPVTGP